MLSTMTYRQQLTSVANVLCTFSAEPYVEAEYLLQCLIGCDRTSLHRHANRVLPKLLARRLDVWLALRKLGYPLAYITGQSAFAEHDFSVSTNTLVPRSESMCLLDVVLDVVGHCQHIKLADLGCGSGIIGLSLALQKPHWQVWLCDYDRAALDVARHNARNLGALSVHISHGSWCEALPDGRVDVLVSNPPYIGRDEPEARDLKFEPVQALYASDDGYHHIRLIVIQSRRFLNKSGWLVLEHGYRQGEKVRNMLLSAGFSEVTTLCDAYRQERVTLGTWR